MGVNTSPLIIESHDVEVGLTDFPVPLMWDVDQSRTVVSDTVPKYLAQLRLFEEIPLVADLTFPIPDL